MKYAFTMANDTGELVLDGDITIENARSLHTALSDHQGAVSELVVNFSAVREIDVTCLQVLCAAHHAATKENRGLKLANIGPVTMNTIKSLGFMRHVGCREDCNGSCLWMLRDTA